MSNTNFGEHVDGYALPVLNEREARAGAGILFALAMISFMNAFLTHNFTFTKIFVTLFMVDFFIRIFINPKYAPSLILGRVAVQHQRPEYVGAAQKRFAWSIGLVLSVVMFLLIVVFEIMTPIKIVICIVCIILLFSESAFGICLGCKIYPLINKKALLQCAGDSCECKVKEPIQELSTLQYIIIIIFIVFTTAVTYFTLQEENSIMEMTPKHLLKKYESGKCGTGKCATGKCGG